jgi:hypothetical protein
MSDAFGEAASTCFEYEITSTSLRKLANVASASHCAPSLPRKRESREPVSRAMIV